MMSEKQLRQLLIKLNSIGGKIDMLVRRLCSSETAAAPDIPQVPSGLTLPTDTVKDLRDAASTVNRDPQRKQQLVTNSNWS